MPNAHANNPNFTRDERTPRWRLSRVDDRADVVVGGDTFAPSVTSSKWGGRCSMTVSARDCAADVSSEQHATGTLEAAMVRTSRGRGNGQAGRQRGELHRWYIGDSLDWDIVWQSANDLPDDTDASGNPIVEFDVSSPPGLTFYHQPALTQSEIDEGGVRPDRVVNSYAAYWNQAGRYLKSTGDEIVNYETGKYCHLYRPVLITARGETAWCSQNIDGGTLTVTLPADVLASLGPADYPLTLDPTFGYTSNGATLFSRGNDWCRCLVAGSTTYTASSGDEITAISIYGGNHFGISLDCYAAVYSISSSVPQSRLATAATVNVTATGPAWWTTSGLSWSMSDGVQYGPAYQQTTYWESRYDTGSGTQNSQSTTDPLPATWTENTTGSEIFSMYATYTAAPTANVPAYIHHYKQAGAL